MIANRLKKNAQKLKGWISDQKIEAYRIYDRDIPEYPYIIDIYLNHAVIYEKANKQEETTEFLVKRSTHLLEIMDAVCNVLSIPKENLFLKQRVRQEGAAQYQKLARDEDVFTIKESGQLFEVNLSDYLDTGLFLDHRPLRKRIKNMDLNGMNFLNLFAYTGSVSVMAATAGAHTTTVDMSRKYTEWTKNNFRHNDLDTFEHEIITENCFTFLDDCTDKYDLIFLDPPSFSNSKKMEEDFNINDDQEMLVGRVMKILKHDGMLLFSNNSRKFKLSEKIQDRYMVKDISRATIPVDFRDDKIHKCFEIRHK